MAQENSRYDYNHQDIDPVIDNINNKSSSEESSKRKYYFQIDVMKTLCIIVVVAIHNIGRYMFPVEQLWHIFQPIPLFLIISGFNFGNSFKRKNLHSLKEMYTFDYLKNAFWRFIFPLLIINLVCFITDMIAVSITSYHVYGWSNFKLWFTSWGTNNASYFIMTKPALIDILMGVPIFPGPGMYYIPILLQFVVFFPLIYKLFEKRPIIGLISCFLIEIIFQLWIAPLIVAPLDDNNVFFSGNMLRYLSAIALGVWFVDNHDIFSKKNLPIVAMSIVSFFILLAFFFGDVWLPWLDNFNIFGYNVFKRNECIDYGFSLSFLRTEPWWGKANFLTYFYPALWFLLFMKLLPSNLDQNKKNNRKIVSFFRSFSKITYHILLVQAIFFWVIIPISDTNSFQWTPFWYDISMSNLVEPYLSGGGSILWREVPFNDAIVILEFKYLIYIFTLVVIVVLSLIFYKLDNRLQKGIKHLLGKTRIRRTSG
ncbi:MAG: acyltransferase [Candidatus Lokiarchaeota archaeon]|nr:acyltransferase [Candidatus Lokiarchaeota archaeon]